MTRALLIESDFKLQLALRCYLTYKGFNTTVCSNTAEAKKLIQKHQFGLFVVDIQMLDENAFTFVKYLRTRGHYTPALFIGERSYKELMDRECSFLDENMVKPFNLQELNTALTRVLVKANSPRKPLLSESVHIDEKLNLLMFRERIIPLGKMEMKILVLLARKAGQVVSPEKIHALVKHEGGKFNIRVFSYISGLRTKLEEAGIRSLQINFVRDGYRLDVVAGAF